MPSNKSIFQYHSERILKVQNLGKFNLILKNIFLFIIKYNTIMFNNNLFTILSNPTFKSG